jgi:hypothetical protein
MSINDTNRNGSMPSVVEESAEPVSSQEPIQARESTVVNGRHGTAKTFATRADAKGPEGIDGQKLVLLGGGLAVAGLFFVFTAVVGRSPKKPAAMKQSSQQAKPEVTKPIKGSVTPVMDIRVAFAKAGVLHSWKSDLEIASKNLVLENGAAKDFDAVAGIEVDGMSRTIGIEYERSPKAAARYRAIREVFERDETTDAVLYLTANDDILYLLAMELRAMRKRIGFVLSDAFRRSFLETRTLTNSSNSEVVPLRDFLCGKQL